MHQFPRGIAPDLLVSQVKNTMPWLFEPEACAPALEAFPPAQVLRGFDPTRSQALTHFEYFELCLSSHLLSCGTPVPTDVDNQIRQKLWSRQLPLEVALQMADLVLQSRGWDYTLVSSRYVKGAMGSARAGEALSGHLGEWFTVSCGAYCALKPYGDPLADAKAGELFENIADEIKRHGEIFASLWKACDGVQCLIASANIAHNLGDLDRVMDMWELSPGDPLRTEYYKIGTLPFDSNGKLRQLGRLWVAGELYKSGIDGSSMALENHRHYALRKPRALRKKPEFCIPNGPFFDEWGGTVARGLSDENGGTPSEEALEVIQALTLGWDRQPRSAGYGRGLRGILEVFPKLDTTEMMKVPGHRKVIEMSRAAFERRWGDEALKHLEDIPSRAK